MPYPRIGQRLYRGDLVLSPLLFFFAGQCSSYPVFFVRRQEFASAGRLGNMK